ncbi:MAG: hypothetical protein M0P77_04240 [Firmicutes bacterium]|nr:hypothetical protein [Bacillota bacterium]
MENEQLFEFMTKMYSDMKEGFKKVDDKFEKIDERFEKIDERFEKIEEDLAAVKKEVKTINNTVVRIEVEHGEKLSALFDGYKQNSDKLDRIEEKVSTHDDFILKRVFK